MSDDLHVFVANLEKDLRRSIDLRGHLLAPLEEAEFLLEKATDGFKAPEERERFTKAALVEVRLALAAIRGEK